MIEALNLHRGTLHKIVPGKYDAGAIAQHVRDGTAIARNHLYATSQRLMNDQRFGFIGVLGRE
jgi:hypothetical protein